MNTIVENVLREIEFQAGLVLGSFGINADIKSIQGLLNKKSIKNSVIYGSAAAAIVVTKVGCSPAMPNNEELELFLKENMISSFKEN